MFAKPKVNILVVVAFGKDPGHSRESRCVDVSSENWALAAWPRDTVRHGRRTTVFCALQKRMIILLGAVTKATG